MRHAALLSFCLPALCATPPAPPVEILAAHLKRLSALAGLPDRIACRDVDMAMALKREGIGIDPRSPVAWAATAAQARAFRAEGRFVVCADPALLPEGAALVLRLQGGQLRMDLHRAHAVASGLPLSDTLLKGVRLL